MKIELWVLFDSINNSFHNIAAVGPDLPQEHFIDLRISRIGTAAIFLAKDVIIVKQKDVLIFQTFNFDKLNCQVLLILCSFCLSFK